MIHRCASSSYSKTYVGITRGPATAPLHCRKSHAHLLLHTRHVDSDIEHAFRCWHGASLMKAQTETHCYSRLLRVHWLGVHTIPGARGRVGCSASNTRFAHNVIGHLSLLTETVSQHTSHMVLVSTLPIPHTPSGVVHS